MYLSYLLFVLNFICLFFFYLLRLLLNMPEMAHDWFNKSILFYSILFCKLKLVNGALWDTLKPCVISGHFSTICLRSIGCAVFSSCVCRSQATIYIRQPSKKFAFLHVIQHLKILLK